MTRPSLVMLDTMTVLTFQENMEKIFRPIYVNLKLKVYEIFTFDSLSRRLAEILFNLTFFFFWIGNKSNINHDK